MPAERQYVDSCVLLAFVRDEPGRAPTVEQILREGSAGDRDLVTSTIAVVEVAFTAEQAKGGALDPGTLAIIDDLWEGGDPITLIEASIPIMKKARDIAREARSRDRSITPLDAMHLATAATRGAAMIYTYEKATRRELWSELVQIPVKLPTLAQPPLL